VAHRDRPAQPRPTHPRLPRQAPPTARTPARSCAASSATSPARSSTRYPATSSKQRLSRPPLDIGASHSRWSAFWGSAERPTGSAYLLTRRQLGLGAGCPRRERDEEPCPVR
jgi:hypothetical protein